MGSSLLWLSIVTCMRCARNEFHEVLGLPPLDWYNLEEFVWNLVGRVELSSINCLPEQCETRSEVLELV